MKQRPLARSSSVATALALSLLSPRVMAECLALPSPDGSLSAWLVSAPYDNAQARPQRPVDVQITQALTALSLSAAAPRIGGTAPRGGTWVASAQPSAMFDVGRAVERSGRGARVALLGATLIARSATRVQLMHGTDDGSLVLLDGREISRRGAVREARDDDDRTALELSAGRHRLVIAIVVNGGDLRSYTRIVGDDFLPTNTVQIALEGVDDARCSALAAQSARLVTTRRIEDGATSLTATLSYPGGTTLTSATPARALTIGASGTSLYSAATLPIDGAFAPSATTTVRAPSAQASLTVLYAGASREASLRFREAHRRAITDAAALFTRLDLAPSALPRPTVDSVRYVYERLRSLVEEGDDDGEHLDEESRTLAELVRDVSAGRDPYLHRRGAMRRGYRSPVDGSLQGYSVFVPPSYRGDRATPVVMALHGLGGSAHRMLPILFGIYDKEDTRTHADRHFPELPDTRAILVAPYGHGDAYYRGVGEYDVRRVLEEVRAAYRTDINRTYMTGLSMGGIGAASIPLHTPDLFAAAAPLCGYHSYFVRRDTDGPRRPWELPLMEFRSNASWAENAEHLPFYVVQGTRDRPVTNSTVLVDRLRELHYNIEAEYPDLGHDVWTTTYAQGRIVPYFLRTVRDPSPSHVRFRTMSLRWKRSYWVELDRVDANGVWASIDVRASGAAMRATTQNVRALTLHPFGRPQRYQLTIDGDALAIDNTSPVSLVRDGTQHWQIAATRAPSDRVLGPIREAFDGPLLVVYGTQRAAETAMNQRVAAHWARIRPGIRANVRVTTDADYRAEDGRERTVVLVGSPASNSVLQRLQARLPIRVESDGIYVGARRIDGIGTTFVAANPEVSDGRLVVVSGTGPVGIWRSRFLPELLPDYVVYNDSVGPARGRVLLGRYASVRCAGFLRPDGTVPTTGSCEDPMAAQISSAASGTEAPPQEQ